MMRNLTATALVAATVLVALSVASVGTKAKVLQAGGVGRIDQLIAEMTLDEKISMLHGGTDPENLGQAGYLPGIARLGIPPMRLTDGPAGVRTGHPATALPAPVALASTFSPQLARQYGQVIGRDGAALRQDVILAPMVNIVRVPQGGRNFETLGEDPFLASRMVEAEIAGIEGEGLIATVKHFAENNQETQRQLVSADVDEQTMREIELPAFEAAVKAGVGSVMAAYNKVNGTWASENTELQTKILRDDWGFKGFVMSDWGATHSAVPALTSGLEMEMPRGTNYAKLADAVKSGQLAESVIDQAVRRILVQMDRMGMLAPGRKPRVAGTIAPMSPAAEAIAVAGAVLLKNDGHVLPLATADLAKIAVIGPTARALLVGGGGSAQVPPMHLGSVVDELKRRAPNAQLTYAVGYDLEGDLIPASAVTPNGNPGMHGFRRVTSEVDTLIVPTIDFTGPKALAAGSTVTWSGVITAPVSGDYELRLQTSGGRGAIAADAPPPAPGAPATAPAPAGRGGRGGGGGGGNAGLLRTSLGLTNPSTTISFEAGVGKRFTITATAGATTPMEVRLAWIPPGWREQKIREAAEAARASRVAVVFAYDEGSEGRDRGSVSLLGVQDALIQAVAAANPRTVVVLNNGAPILMPWAGQVAGILQMWYPGQEGAAATAALLLGAASPGGRLPVTFPRRLEDAPTNTPERYPGVNGHGTYSEGIFVGYRWYDHENIEPLFPFGHGLSYTDFAYSDVSVAPAGDGFDVTFMVRNTGARDGDDVPQVYLGPPDPAPAPMAVRKLVGFSRISLAAGKSQQVTVHIGARELSYWSTTSHGWVVAAGRRALAVGASSRDLRLKTEIRVPSR